MKNKALLIVLTLLFYITELKAQHHETKGNGKITGTIIDSLSGQALEYATIGLIATETNKAIDGSASDDKGTFTLEEVPSGNYKLQIYFIGYKTLFINNITISAEHSTLALENIKLSTIQSTLREVEVTAERSLIENKIDKLVYNVDKDLTSQGGVASDVLKKVPMVSVDVNGNVELQGNANIRFLINGKPSSVFGNNLSDVLQSIPVSQIQSIEVITSPGAKYDAEGTGGIINIILKKVTAQGVNGNLSLSAGTRLENGSLNLSVRKGKFGVNAFGSGNAQLLSTTLNKMNRQSLDPSSNESTTLLQDGKSNFSRSGYQTGLSFDWELSPKDNLSGGLSYNYFANNTKGYTTRETISKDSNGNTLADVSNLIGATSNFNSQSYDWNLNYKHKFKKEDQELDILYSASDGANYSYYLQTQSYLSPDVIYNGSNGKNPGRDKQTNISLNYVQPVNKHILMEAGAKTVLNQLNSKSDVFLLNTTTDNYDYNTSRSNTINYNRNVYAAYVSSTFKLKFLDIKAGARYEYTETQANYSNAGKVNVTPYFSFVPSAVVSHTFKNNNLLKLSYTHRIQRPDYRDLNPFINASDPKNFTSGNPNLKPEFSDKIELGYNAFLKKGATLNVSLFSQFNRQDIQQYTVFYPTYTLGDSVNTNITLTTRENIGSENNFGLNVFASVPVTSNISLRCNASAFQRYIINSIDPGMNISGFNYRINLNASYQITNTLSVELFGNFNSPRINAQGKMPSFTTYNFALRKQFLNKKASLAITATNPFNKYVNQKSDLTGSNFTSITVRQLPYRSFGINFTYKFGKLEFKKDKVIEDTNLTNPQGAGN